MTSGKRHKRKTVGSASGGAGRIFIPIAAAVLTCAAVFFILRAIGAGFDTSYKGLSAPQVPEMNIYTTDHFFKKHGLLYYRDSNFTSKPGIDVSTYQKKIDWKKVYKSGIRFAMIRVGYRTNDTGKILKDKRFEENIKGAAKAGLDTGVYFFSEAKTRKEAVEEARFVLKNIKGKKITYPVAFDMEDTKEKNRHEDLTKKERTIIADAFCHVIENNGYTPMIYAYPGWIYNNVSYTRLTRYDMWLAHYTKRTTYPFHYRIWQYTSKGKVKGIDGRVDLDIVFIKKKK